jgi:predicted fused transcriptional regulator/phosphomethylpyrimidine kinase
MRVYLTAMRDALATAFPTIGFNLAVRSKTTKTTPHVVRIQGGDVVDTQRRRRDNLPEAYSSLSFP